MYDVIVIGAGPAGITSAIYAKRAGLNVLVLYYGKSILQTANKIDNYYGFINGISGEELYKNGIKQAKNLEIDILEKEVIDIKMKEDLSFSIKSSDKEFSSKAIIIATGNKMIRPNINGISEFEGKGISYCAICDGFFYKNKNVVVIGSGKFAQNEANDLKDIVKSIKILTNGEENPNIEGYEIDTRKIKKIHGEEKVSFIEFEDGNRLNIDGIFIAQGIASSNSFAKKLGLLTNGENISVNENMKTNIDGIFACGNLTGGLLQVNKAAYEGAIAGLQAAEYIKSLNK